MKSLFQKVVDQVKSVLKGGEQPVHEQYATQEDGYANTLSSFLAESKEKAESRWKMAKFSQLETYQELKEWSHEERLGFQLHLMRFLTNKELSYSIPEYVQGLLSQLLRRKSPYRQEELRWIMETVVNLRKTGGRFDSAYAFPYAPLLSQVESAAGSEPLEKSTKALLQSLLFHRERIYLGADEVKVNQRITMLLGAPSPDENVSIILPSDRVGKILRGYLNDSPDSWQSLLPHIGKSGGKSTPSEKWLNESAALLPENIEEIARQAEALFKEVTDLLKEAHKKDSAEVFNLSENSIAYVRGLIWCIPLINDIKLSNAAEELGLICYKKMKGVGALGVKLGNAVLYAFSRLPFQDGMGRLAKFKAKIKYRSVQTLIDNTIARAAKRAGKTPAEIEEMGVGAFGLVNGTYEEELGDYTAILEIISLSKVELKWKGKTGKVQKTVPAAIKEEYAEDVKALKAKAKDIQTTLSAQKGRIESFYLADIQLTAERWKKYYLDHPLVSHLTELLIWQFEKDGETHVLLPADGGFLNSSGEPVELNVDGYSVRLWHPISGAVDEVQKWRQYFLDREIQQPFKQAFREIYIVTDAEITTRSYSNRFAAHILRQHQFTALCQQRGWQYTLMGQWDSHNTPTLTIPAFGMQAEFWVEADDANGIANDMGIYNYIFTDQVRFYSEREQLNMTEVPEVVFSEVMRDVDLFVGVTSIGNDPNWLDGGEDRYNSYWEKYAVQDLSESAKVRKQTLEFIVPKLKIRDKASFDGNYLRVKGSIREYKIHIGSGNILMEPNNQYLCIVTDRKATNSGKVFLPFEGDQMLSIIISKALLLADDDKITDSTIISQLRR